MIYVVDKNLHPLKMGLWLPIEVRVFRQNFISNFGLCRHWLVGTAQAFQNTSATVKVVDNITRRARLWWHHLTVV